MIEAWRIVKAIYADDAYSGEGSVMFAARWHSAGTRIVYTAESVSLATLELLVHLSRPDIPQYSLIPCHFHEALVEDLDPARLPEDWMNPIAPVGLRRFGDEWARDRRSAVLRVPSAVTLTESNYLLNPEHPDFASIEISEPRPLRLDYRLIT